MQEVPFVSKTFNINFIELATRVMLGQESGTTHQWWGAAYRCAVEFVFHLVSLRTSSR